MDVSRTALFNNAPSSRFWTMNFEATPDSAWFERAIVALESQLGGVVTIIDNQGVFQTASGRMVFPRKRQSHRKIPACEAGFSQHCIETCRHAMNAACEERQTPFIKHCWKGLVEIVVPLRREGRHLGMLYYGIWRQPGFSAPLPREAGEAIAALPLWDEERFPALAALLEAFAAGLVARLETFPTTPDWRGKISALLARHASTPGFGLVELAGALHLSPSHVGRLIRQHFAKNFVTLLHETRVSRAKALLLSSDERLRAIALAVGFYDEYHFSKVFRKVAGVTPGAFRKEQEFTAARAMPPRSSR